MKIPDLFIDASDFFIDASSFFTRRIFQEQMYGDSKSEMFTSFLLSKTLRPIFEVISRGISKIHVAFLFILNCGIKPEAIGGGGVVH